jgi:hypothetical protein
MSEEDLDKRVKELLEESEESMVSTPKSTPPEETESSESKESSSQTEVHESHTGSRVFEVKYWPKDKPEEAKVTYVKAESEEEAKGQIVEEDYEAEVTGSYSEEEWKKLVGQYAEGHQRGIGGLDKEMNLEDEIRWIRREMSKLGLKEVVDLPSGEGIAEIGSEAYYDAFGAYDRQIRKIIRDINDKIRRFISGKYRVDAYGRVIPLGWAPFLRELPLVTLKTKRIFFEIRIPHEEYSVPFWFELDWKRLVS